MKKLYIGLIMSVLGFVLGCTQDRSLPSGYDVLERDDKGAVKVMTLKAVESAGFWRTPTPGLEPTLLLGNDEHLTAHFILKFFDLSAVDTATVFSARLFLTNSYQDGEVASAQAPVYPVTTDWNENSVTWEDISENVDFSQQAGILEYNGQNTDSLELSAVSFDIDPDLVNRWVADESVNEGLFFDGTDIPVMIEFLSVDNTDYWPYLQVVHVNKSGETDTTILNNYLKDAGLVVRKENTAENTLQHNKLCISSAGGDRSLLKFDVGMLPEECTIHQAILNMTINSGEKYIRNDGFVITAATVISDSLWDPLSVKADSVNAVASATIAPEDDKAAFTNSTAIRNMIRIVQSWVLDRENNNGLFLQSANPGRTPQYVTFYSDSAQADLLPTLELTYSVPPAPRFTKP